jgi:hypothetical protein
MPPEFLDPQRFANAVQKAEIHARDGGRCWYCKEEVPSFAFEADHVVPYHRGGRTSLENLVTACVPCNQVKGRQTEASYRRQLRLRGREWRDEEYLYLRWEEETSRLSLAPEPAAHVVIEDVIRVQTLSEGTFSKKITQSPTGPFALLQADMIANDLGANPRKGGP